MKNTVSVKAAGLLDQLSLPDIVPVERLAEHLRLSRSTVREHLRRGALPGRKIGGRWFVTRRDLLAFLEAPQVVAFPSRSDSEGV